MATTMKTTIIPLPPTPTTTTTTMTKTRTSGLSPFPSSQKKVIVTPYQERVYALLQQIPSGKITSYAALSRALNSSPRAVGGALRNNPFAPEIPCHRCIASTGYIGGFKGDWEKAPSGINCEMKLESLKEEGVEFDGRGMLLDRTCWWDDFKVKG